MPRFDRVYRVGLQELRSTSLLGIAMLSPPLYLFFGSVTIWGFFNVGVAGWVFVSTSALFSGWLLFASWSLRSSWIMGLAQDAFTNAEAETFRKYAFYFIYPFQAKQYSYTFSLLQVLCLVWFAICVWRQEWVLLGCLFVLFLVASNMAPYMNQGNFLRHHKERGNLSSGLLDRLELVQAVESKIIEARTRRRDAQKVNQHGR